MNWCDSAVREPFVLPEGLPDWPRFHGALRLAIARSFCCGTRYLGLRGFFSP